MLIFSCGGETSTSTNTSNENSPKVVQASKPMENTPPKTDIATTVQPTETKIEEVKSKEISPKVEEVEKPSPVTKVPAKTISNPIPSKMDQKADEAKAQIEEAKQKALLDKTNLEEEMRKAEAEKKRKEDLAKQAKIEAQAKAELEAKTKAKKDKIAVAEKPAFSHTAFDALLKKYVSSSGKVNYNGFKADEKKLDAYLAQLEATPIEKSWSKNKKMAYWINAYNGYTIKLILNNHPVKSITDLHGGKPWDVKWIKLDGRTLSLNNIENDILRPTYKDARIHFAVNCAAKSCPTLLNRAWTEGNLNANFEKQAKAFINNANFNSISKNSIEVSKIFEWYKVDFGNLIDYLNKYSTTKINSDAKINFMEYDWALNK